MNLGSRAVTTSTVWSPAVVGPETERPAERVHQHAAVGDPRDAERVRAVGGLARRVRPHRPPTCGRSADGT